MRNWKDFSRIWPVVLAVGPICPVFYARLGKINSVHKRALIASFIPPFSQGTAELIQSQDGKLHDGEKIATLKE